MKAIETWTKNVADKFGVETLDRIQCQSSLEGVQWSALEGEFKEKLVFKTFPTKSVKIQSYNLHSHDPQLLEEDKAEGIDHFLVLVRSERVDAKAIKSFNNPIVLLERPELLSTQHFLDHPNTFIDPNELLGDDFAQKIASYKQSNFVINTAHIHNAGGSLVQELTYMLFMLENLVRLGAKADQLLFITSVNSEFFLSTAKVMALRALVERFYETKDVKYSQLKILTTSSLREQTLYNPWMNILRNSTGAMAGFVGGADFVDLRPYDHLFNILTEETPSNFSKRVARHALGMLDEESRLQPAELIGHNSFSLNALVHNIIENTQTSFTNWSERPFTGAQADFRKAVLAIAKERSRQVLEQKKVISGVNQYVDLSETLQTLYQRPWKPVEIARGAYPLRRPVSFIENLRLRVEFLEGGTIINAHQLSQELLQKVQMIGLTVKNSSQSEAVLSMNESGEIILFGKSYQKGDLKDLLADLVDGLEGGGLDE